MGGRPKDPEYWRKWRAANPAYRRRERERKTRLRASMTPEQRRRDRGIYKPRPLPEPLPVLMAHLMHGTRVSFWEDELRLDLAQEEQLALLEGRDPQEAVRQYRSRELYWHSITCPFLDTVGE